MRREEGPVAGDTFELVVAAWLEPQTGSGGEVDDGAGDEDLVWVGQCGDASCDVHGDPGDIGCPEFDFAGM